MFELGNNLREARHRRQIDLVIAEQDTKIRSKYLSALETEDFDILPGPVFVRGFLRTYSRYLGLDPQLFIDEYNARFGRFEDVEEQASPALGRPSLAQERATRGRRTMRTIVILSLVAIAAFAYLGLRDQERAASHDEGRKAASKPVNPEPSSADPGALGNAAAAASDASAATPAAPRASSERSTSAKQ